MSGSTQGTFLDEFITVKEAVRQLGFTSATQLDRTVIKHSIPILKGSEKYKYRVHRDSLWRVVWNSQTATLKRARPKRDKTPAEKEWARLRGKILPHWKKIWTKEGVGNKKKTVETQYYKKANGETKAKLMKGYEDAVKDANKAKRVVDKEIAERNAKKKK